MVSVRKRGKVYEYRFEVATVEGTRKWITKSGYPSKAEAFKEGAKALFFVIRVCKKLCVKIKSFLW